MKIVTSGSAYLDIDAYAGCVAYAELLQAQGTHAVAVSTAPLNESISRTVRSWQAPLQTTLRPHKDDTFTLIDVSDPDFFDKIVDHSHVDEIIDHHPGFEQHWQEQLANKAKIEFIGAACTLVYEQWKAAGLLEKMTVTSARLLVCGILDNTLNFGANVTTSRDKEAYDALLKRADLPVDWVAQYFSECQESILSDIAEAIDNDTKTITFKSFPQSICVGQLTVWSAKQVLAEHQDTLRKTLADVRPNWFMNLICIEEGKSYFISDSDAVQQWLEKLLNLEFDQIIATTDRLWLRKEIIKQDLTLDNLNTLAS